MERCLWVVLVLISIVLQIQFVMPILAKHQNTKTITTIDTTNYPIWNIDFPGVSVCSNIRVSQSLYKATMTHSRHPWANHTDEDKEFGFGQLVLNLVQFQSDPDLLYFTNQSNEILNDYSDLIEKLMATVCSAKHLAFSYHIILRRSARPARGCSSTASGRERGWTVTRW